MWMGASDVAKEGTYVWSTSHNDTSSFSHWGSNPGTVTSDQKNCMSLERVKTATGTHWGWMEEDCSDKQYFMCEKL